MRPNEFIMNTDYLSIAQTSSGKQEFYCVVPGGTVAAGGQMTHQVDFSIPTQKGAIDCVMIKKDNDDYKVGHRLEFNIGQAYAQIIVDRTTSSNLRFEIRINNFVSSSATTYPIMTFRIKISSFKPPNVF